MSMLMSMRFILICYSNTVLALFHCYYCDYCKNCYYCDYCKNCYYCEIERRSYVSLSGAPCSVANCNKTFALILVRGLFFNRYRNSRALIDWKSLLILAMSAKEKFSRKNKHKLLNYGQWPISEFQKPRPVTKIERRLGNVVEILADAEERASK